MVGRQSYAPPENVPINKGNQPEQIAPAVSMNRSREVWEMADCHRSRWTGWRVGTGQRPAGRWPSRRSRVLGHAARDASGGSGERKVCGGARPPGRCSADSSRAPFIHPTVGLNRWTASLHRWGTMLGAGDGSAQGHTASGPKGCALSTPWPTWMPSL